MKRLFTLIISILLVSCFALSLGWAEFYTDLSQESRKELAEAYYMAGEQYKQVGKTKKGQDFIDMAYKIYPGLTPSAIGEPQRTQKRPTSVQTSWKPSYPKTPPSVAPDQNLVLYQFSRFLRAFITEDIEVMKKVLDSSVYIDAIDDWVSEKEIEGYLTTIFDAYPIDKMPPSDLIRLETIEISKLSDYLWKGSVEITDVPEIGLNESINVDSLRQEFFFRPDASSWLIFAAGALPEKSEVVLFPERYIGDAFLSCLDHFLHKRPGKAAGYFTDPFHNVPLGAYVSREELAMTFLGYYEEYDVTALGDVSVSMEIDAAEDYSHPSGRIFKVYVTLKGDTDEDSIPFWKSFRGYYFVFDEKETAWNIAAVF